MGTGSGRVEERRWGLLRKKRTKSKVRGEEGQIFDVQAKNLKM